MPGMTMAGEPWYGAAAGYLCMWMAMMVPMMLPSLIPMLTGYRRSLRGTDGVPLHGLTVLVGVGYFTVWAVLGAAASAARAGVVAAESSWGAVAQGLPALGGVVLLVAGSLQFTSWKARRLALCRDGSGCGCVPAHNAVGAWRHGLDLGVRCSLCCGSLMLALLAVGMADLVAAVAVTLAISAERLARAPRLVARVAGVAMMAVGMLTIARG